MFPNTVWYPRNTPGYNFGVTDLVILNCGMQTYINDRSKSTQNADDARFLFRGFLVMKTSF